MSKTNIQHKTGRKSSSSSSIAHVDVSRRHAATRTFSPKNECLVVEAPDRKRSRSRHSNRKCKQTATKSRKPYNELIAYIVAAFAMTCSWHITALLEPNHKPTTPVTAPVALPLSAPISASGEWQMEAVIGQEFLYGVTFIKQDNSSLYGEGKDPQGTYTVEGKLWSDRVWFIKRYDDEARAMGAPKQDMVFDGIISTSQNRSLTMCGKFETQVKSGFATSYYQKTQWQTVCGRWSARQIGILPADRSLRMQSRQDSWNPLRNLDAQPSSQASCPVAIQEAEHKQQEQLAVGFYCFLATAVLALFGWTIYAAYRLLRLLSEHPTVKADTPPH